MSDTIGSPRVYTDADLRGWRGRERLSQAEVANLFSVRQVTVCRWEKGMLPKTFSGDFEQVLVDFYAAKVDERNERAILSEAETEDQDP